MHSWIALSRLCAACSIDTQPPSNPSAIPFSFWVPTLGSSSVANAVSNSLALHPSSGLSPVVNSPLSLFSNLLAASSVSTSPASVLFCGLLGRASSGLIHFNSWSLFLIAPAVLPFVMAARDLARSPFSKSGLQISLAWACSFASSSDVHFIALRRDGSMGVAVAKEIVLVGRLGAGSCGETAVGSTCSCRGTWEGLQPRCCSRFLRPSVVRWEKKAWRSARWSFFSIPSVHSSLAKSSSFSSSALLHSLLFFCRSLTLSSFTSSWCWWWRCIPRLLSDGKALPQSSHVIVPWSSVGLSALASISLLLCTWIPEGPGFFLFLLSVTSFVPWVGRLALPRVARILVQVGCARRCSS